MEFRVFIPKHRRPRAGRPGARELKYFKISDRAASEVAVVRARLTTY